MKSGVRNNRINIKQAPLNNLSIDCLVQLNGRFSFSNWFKLFAARNRILHSIAKNYGNFHSLALYTVKIQFDLLHRSIFILMTDRLLFIMKIRIQRPRYKDTLKFRIPFDPSIYLGQNIEFEKCYLHQKFFPSPNKVFKKNCTFCNETSLGKI